MKIRYFIAALVLALFIVSCSESGIESEADRVESVINEVSISSLRDYVNILSGETSFNYNGVPTVIQTRNWAHTGNDIAADYIESTLSGFNLQVFNQYFGELGRNVFAIQNGNQFSHTYYVIGAHYDNCGILNCDPENSAIAPGADDNASGTAAVLEAARIMSDYEFNYSIIYALWDEEERGLFGSKFFADSARTNNISIAGYINLDMIGWNSDDELKAHVIVWDTENIPMLGQSVVTINEQYNIGLDFEFIFRDRGSDFIYFWVNDFPAVSIIEDFNDFNANYHSLLDLISNMDMDYYLKMSKTAIGTLAYLAIGNF